ncbi:MAG: glycosyltransferase family 4 protein [Acidobacteriaceae bacterium]
MRALAAASMFSGSFPKTELRRCIEELTFVYPRAFSHPTRLGIAEAYVSTIAPKADIQIATSFETVRPTALLSGKKFYFGQHFEPYFASEFPDSSYASAIAHQSYHLGFNLIANSSWLRNKLQSEVCGARVDLCPNAIDHTVFCGDPKPPATLEKLVVISYGGRSAEWKGFREMAEAIGLVRARSPQVLIDWRVYGDALLPPGNRVAPYTHLGFLQAPELAKAYRGADILLSASWYESFPLFPIEAMACGLPVICTQPGTEEYAIARETAEVVQPRSVSSIAEGLDRLVHDPEYRHRLAVAGNRISKEFTWERSAAKLESILMREQTADDSCGARSE